MRASTEREDRQWYRAVATLQGETMGPGQCQGQCRCGEAGWRDMKEAGGGQTLEMMACRELGEGGRRVGESGRRVGEGGGG